MTRFARWSSVWNDVAATRADVSTPGSEYAMSNEYIDTLNKDYFIVDVGSDTVIGREDKRYDGPRQWTAYNFRSFEAFKRKLIKRKLLVNTTSKQGLVAPTIKPLANYWISNSEGRQYDTIVYAPEGSPIIPKSDDLNGWKGFAVPEPRPRYTGPDGRVVDWALTREVLIKDILCGHDPALYGFTLD